MLATMHTVEVINAQENVPRGLEESYGSQKVDQQVEHLYQQQIGRK